jgi:hypothetical protein
VDSSRLKNLALRKTAQGFSLEREEEVGEEREMEKKKKNKRKNRWSTVKRWCNLIPTIPIQAVLEPLL